MTNPPANKPVLEYFEEILTEIERVGGQSYFISLARLVDTEIALYEGRIDAVKRELKNWPAGSLDPAMNLRHVLPIFEAELQAIEKFRSKLRQQHGV